MKSDMLKSHEIQSMDLDIETPQGFNTFTFC
jgi:hypothetical protein